MSNTNYIYLLRTREFINADQHIYKVGRTSQERFKRIGDYSKGSETLIIRKCLDCIKMEAKIIKILKSKYINRTDIGREWFEGDSNHMMDDINNSIKNEVKKDVDKVKNDSKYRIKWNQEGHIDHSNIYTVTIKDVDKKRGTCSIQYKGVKRFDVDQSLSNFEVIDDIGIKLPSIDKKSNKRQLITVENNSTYRIKWNQEGHAGHGELYTVTTTDVNKKRGTCSIQYKGVKRFDVDQSLSNFEVTKKMDVKTPRFVIENNTKHDIKWTKLGGSEYGLIYESVKVKDVTKKTCSLQYYSGWGWLKNQQLSDFEVLQPSKVDDDGSIQFKKRKIT
jgi:hypothetical protein